VDGTATPHDGQYRASAGKRSAQAAQVDGINAAPQPRQHRASSRSRC
jgi:hypothetical protein